jgi:polyisoprenoid-binding protein YceI
MGNVQASTTCPDASSEKRGKNKSHTNPIKRRIIVIQFKKSESVTPQSSVSFSLRAFDFARSHAKTNATSPSNLHLNPNSTSTPNKLKHVLLAVLPLLCLAALAAPLSAEHAPVAQPQDKPAAAQWDVTSGTTATYRVTEQLAGISFKDDAVGSTDAVTGSIYLEPDGTIDSAKSKLTIDLRSLKSDQDMRDGYVKMRTLETDKFPNAEFVPKKLIGVPNPIPAPDRATGQSGFQLVGDLTVHGVTKEVTLNGYATFSKDTIAGRAQTDFTFATFGLMKPTLARILSVDDKIQLDILFKLKKS